MSWHPRIILNWLLPPIRPLEAAILAGVADKLPAEWGKLFRHQVAQFNFVVRLNKDKEINFYCLKAGKPWHDENHRLPMEGEVVIARASISSNEMSRRVKAEVYVISGWVFSIMFDQSPKPFQRGDFIIDSIAVETAPIPESEWQQRSLSTLVGSIGWLHKVFVGDSVVEEKGPLGAGQIEEIRNGIEAVLPADYLALLNFTNGLRVGQVVIHGISNIRQIARSDDNLYVLAEYKGEACLCLRRGSGPEIILVDIEDDSCESAGFTLESAIRLLIERYGFNK
jgi:hypothetical protein